MFRLDRHGSSPAREADMEAATGTWTILAEAGQPRSVGPETHSASVEPCPRDTTLRRLRRAGAVPVATPVPDLESFDTRAKIITWTVVPTATAIRSGGSVVTTSTAKDRRPVRTRTCTIMKVTAVGPTREVMPTTGRCRRPLRIRRRRL